jgi:hypothetical protein
VLVRIFAVLAFVLIWNVSASAGELVLKNGDRLDGRLVKVQDETLIWKAYSFGNVHLSVPKANVASLQTDQTVKIQGRDGGCTIQQLKQGVLSYTCEGQEVTQTELLAIDSMLPYEDFAAGAKIYSGKMALTGVYSSGNSIEEDWDFDAEVVLRRSDYRHKVALDYESDSDNGDKAQQQYELLYRLDWFFDERWFWYNEVKLGADEPKNIDESYVYGTGLGVQVWEFVDRALSFESGIDWVKEELNPTADDLLNTEWSSNRERSAWRFATYVRRDLPYNAKLIHTSEFLYSFDDSDDWLFSADVGVNIPLGPGLFSEYKIEYDYDNKPATDAKREDTKFTVGVGYQW